MFSTNQLEVIQTLVPTMKNQGYDYYIAYTNTDTSSSWGSTTEPDLCIVFSSDEITATSGYSYDVPEGSVMYVIRTGNYSTSQSAVNTDRYEISEYSGILNIDIYEHVYSNSTYSEGVVVMPDINFRGAGETYEKTNALGLVCTAVLLFICFCSFFKR